MASAKYVKSWIQKKRLDLSMTYLFSDFAWHSVNCLRSSLISCPLVAFWRVCILAQFSHIGSGSSQVLQKCVASFWMFPHRQGSQNIGLPVSWHSLFMINHLLHFQPWDIRFYPMNKSDIFHRLVFSHCENIQSNKILWRHVMFCMQCPR